MEEKEFRKLDLNLPRQEVSDPRPWVIAGWLLAIIVLLFIAYTFFER